MPDLVTNLRGGHVALATRLKGVEAQVANLVPGGAQIYDTSNPSSQETSTHAYNAWALTDGSGYEATSYVLATGQREGIATGALPMPADLSTLTYT